MPYLQIFNEANMSLNTSGGKKFLQKFPNLQYQT